MFAAGGRPDTTAPAAVNRLTMIMGAHLGQMDCSVYQVNSREARKFKKNISRENKRVVLL